MSLVSAELSATCNALGYYDENAKKYYADENTLETAKDLIRYLRRDDENHDIRRQLGESKVLETDLLHLLKSYWEETELFDVLLRYELLVFRFIAETALSFICNLYDSRDLNEHFLTFLFEIFIYSTSHYRLF